MDRINFEDIDIYSVLSSMHEGVVIADISGKVIFFNDTQGRIDDVVPKDAIGKKILEIYQLADDTSPILRCLISGAPIINETLVYRTRLGRVCNILFSVFPLYKNGTLIGAINFSKEYQLLEQVILSQSTPAGSVQKTSVNGTRFSFKDIIASDPKMHNAIRIARMSAGSPSPIMISGETGTGKELFAQSIHNHSPRKKQPFIPVNCAAIPENLLEGILFGTSRGSFTGAIDKPGLFEQANGGTIFLDELDAMPLTLQAKLLRIIQEKKVRKLGSLQETDLDVKILSSVGQPPLKIIRNGVLRMDLFYRMGVVSILLPPLRERIGELDTLIRYFVAKYNQALNGNVKTISPRVAQLLAGYDWPGNVRELEHIIEASMNMVGGTSVIRLAHLPPHIFSFAGKERLQTGVTGHNNRGNSQKSSLLETQASNEMEMIMEALTRYRGNAARAARHLGVSPQSFHYKLKKYGINRKDFVSREPV
ncbi:MAG TPA: sigma 54-interacting transcriptional regulator [Desulfotignum sp.]|nr:sigma 54-interacting transcriptional regulator [Desulfotignum sp.]